MHNHRTQKHTPMINLMVNLWLNFAVTQQNMHAFSPLALVPPSRLFCFPPCCSQHSAWLVDCDKSVAPRLFVPLSSQAYKAKVTLKPAAQADQMAAVSLINKGVYR